MGLGLRLGFFYLILTSPPLTRDVTCSRLYLEGKNMKRQCHRNTLVMHLICRKFDSPSLQFKRFILLVFRIIPMPSTKEDQN